MDYQLHLTHNHRHHHTINVNGFLSWSRHRLSGNKQPELNSKTKIKHIFNFCLISVYFFCFYMIIRKLKSKKHKTIYYFHLYLYFLYDTIHLEYFVYHYRAIYLFHRLVYEPSILPLFSAFYSLQFLLNY